MSATEKATNPVRAEAPAAALNELMAVLRQRDPMTAAHSASVAFHAREIAEEIGLPEDECELVELAALLHDVGKLLLPDHILKGTSKLSEADWALVKRHPEHGAWMVAELQPGPLAEIILDHHERLDGTGYPNAIPGAEISLHARIISVADTYDAMTSRDSYRKPVPHDEALAELRRVAGTQLDPTLVEAFIARNPATV